MVCGDCSATEKFGALQKKSPPCDYYFLDLNFLYCVLVITETFGYSFVTMIQFTFLPGTTGCPVL